MMQEELFMNDQGLIAEMKLSDTVLILNKANRDIGRLEFEKWCDMYDLELKEIYAGAKFEDWRKEFYNAGGAIYE